MPKAGRKTHNPASNAALSILFPKPARNFRSSNVQYPSRSSEQTKRYNSFVKHELPHLARSTFFLSIRSPRSYLPSLPLCCLRLFSPRLSSRLAAWFFDDAQRRPSPVSNDCPLGSVENTDPSRCSYQRDPTDAQLALLAEYLTLKANTNEHPLTLTSTELAQAKEACGLNCNLRRTLGQSTNVMRSSMGLAVQLLPPVDRLAKDTNERSKGRRVDI
jgi:hypothetical protein